MTELYKVFFKIEIGIYIKDTFPENLVGWPYGTLGERVWGVKKQKVRQSFP